MLRTHKHRIREAVDTSLATHWSGGAGMSLKFR